MGPKKDKKEKKKGKEADEPKAVGTITEVEKTFLELELAECNRKVARLRTAVDEYEQKNEELQKAYDKLDEDRADIIAYLKKTLNLKSEENNELKDKVKGLEETRAIEMAQFKETVAELERNFSVMKDQLTSENKLLAGKLNTLEEFRAIRDDLMKKYEKQEQDFKDQEMKYKRIIYDAEKKFVIGKDKLKREMESRLLQLAQDFQDATELRIAASTHRVIRENIAINNELDSILSNQTKLAEQNEKLKESEQAARIAKELAEEERDKAINKNVIQLKVIDQLTTSFQNMKKEKAHFEKKSFDLETLQSKIDILIKENEELSLKVRILEQNLHSRLTNQNKSSTEASLLVKEYKKLKKILKEAAITIKAALKLDEWSKTDPTQKAVDRHTLLNQLLEIITKHHEIKTTKSVDTLASLGKVYEEGDLGFIPKVTKKSSVMHTPSSLETKRAPEKSLKSEKLSSESSSSSRSSPQGSLRTVPSMRLVPQSSDVKVESESFLSFITSTKTTLSSEESSESGNETDIVKKIDDSKPSIQKSMMKHSADPEATSESALKEELLQEDNTEDKVSTKELTEAETKNDIKPEEHDSKDTEPSPDVDVEEDIQVTE
ncbi:cilia- and flagella-associated protein 157 [Aricia agestis]|uniref:cilia- and flagella-associated protein 157 n=1 Tax=Aricia agestis TaxID=91739 RepID=UPI001C206112|nr:cilia- and flagella-associated protein 157 [Aricia agestis]